MRAVHRLLGLVRRYGPAPVESACSLALDLDVVSVSKIASMLERGAETTPLVLSAATATAPARFTRDPSEFATDRTPQRLALARQHQLCHLAFLELLPDDEVSRRESLSAALRSAKSGLDPNMRIGTWNALEDLPYDRALLSDPVSLRFADAGHFVLVLGAVGVGKAHLARPNCLQPFTFRASEPSELRAPPISCRSRRVGALLIRRRACGAPVEMMRGLIR